MAIELPEVALVFLFGDVASSAATAEPVAELLAARRLAIVDATGLSRRELEAHARTAADAYTRVYAITSAGGADLAAKRLGTLSVIDTFVVPDGATAEITLRPVSTDQRGELGPFDIIGDVHGCADELVELLDRLGYRVVLSGEGNARRARIEPPSGRRAFFVGDLVDRGPNSPDVLRIVMDMVEAGHALCVAGNHDVACIRWLEGKVHHLAHGMEHTAAQLGRETATFRQRVQTFLSDLKSHLWVDGGRLAVAHAGVQEKMIGRATGRVRAFALYGDTEGKPGADGLPIRYHWALDYAGETAIVYGHTPVAEIGWVNNTLCVDSGCCFGGALTAVRWPEREIVQVPAKAVYAQRGRPFGHPPARPKR
jgi:protein phosphatase